MQAPASLVRLQGIGKDYAVVRTGGGRVRTLVNLLLGRPVGTHFRALAGIDLEIRRGESWGIIGENGAGKSTLLKIIAGVVKPSAGERRVAGRIAALLELGTGFHPDYSGRENVFLASALMGWTRAETSSRLDQILAFADIGEHIDQPVKTYSSGMVVRLGFAVATALSPDLLVTDEVLAVGDESFQKKCLRWLEGYLAGGGTLLLCSHSMYHIQTLCQKAVWIHQGRAHMSGDAHQVTRAYLAHHEERNASLEAPSRPTADHATQPAMQRLWTEDADGRPAERFPSASDIRLCGVYSSPDDTPTVVMAGLMRIDGTPVYGTFSNAAGFASNRVGDRLFAFCFELRMHSLLPGKYTMKAHTLDVHGLRLFDTLETDIVVEGETTEHGMVRLDHSWTPGHLPRS